MAKFAKEANKMAKALGTTTTKYTDASLIYYQQGLDEKAVKQRTDITTKMANVTKESVTNVSDYMTAIWNNFDDGSKSLEYYADVMTALGAATASSTDEIASGLDKFAAVADTVGLSYEYATSALATLTSETR
jgi:TP901 family phage tail tape measure protein